MNQDGTPMHTHARNSPHIPQPEKGQFFGAGETKKNSGRRPLAARSAARGGAKQVRRDKVDFPLRYFAPYFEIAFYLAILGAP